MVQTEMILNISIICWELKTKSRKLLKSRSNSPNRSKTCTEENMHYAWMLLIWESHLSKLQMLILKLAKDTQTAHITLVGSWFLNQIAIRRDLTWFILQRGSCTAHSRRANKASSLSSKISRVLEACRCRATSR